MAVPGREQTNNKAELLAVVLALRAEPGPAEIRTDSDYVYKGACALRRGETRQRGDHDALWSELGQILRARQEVIFTKVEGHVKQTQVDRGLVPQIDKDGNDAADKLATYAAAAEGHATPTALVCRAEKRAS